MTERGAAQSAAAGEAIGRLGCAFEAILFSPKVRARQTADLASVAWPADQRALLAAHPPLAGGFDGRLALDAMAGLGVDGRLLLVGHEPDLSRVIADLCGGRADVKKGGLAIVRLDGAAGELAALLRPRELGLIAASAVPVESLPAGGD